MSPTVAKSLSGFLVLSVFICSQTTFARGYSGYKAYKGSYRKSYGSTQVRGYYKRRSGSHVAPHWRTLPDSSRYNNWSTKGNVNSYTGKRGTRNPYK